MPAPFPFLLFRLPPALLLPPFARRAVPRAGLLAGAAMLRARFVAFTLAG